MWSFPPAGATLRQWMIPEQGGMAMPHLLLVAAVPLPEARSKVRQVTMSGLLHAQAVMCPAVLALKHCTPDPSGHVAI